MQTLKEILLNKLQLNIKDLRPKIEIFSLKTFKFFEIQF